MPRFAAAVGMPFCFGSFPASVRSERPHSDKPSPDGQSERNAAQCPLARLTASDRAPIKTRLKAQVASRLNQLRDRNLRPR
jgi:hypothetical protein